MKCILLIVAVLVTAAAPAVAGEEVVVTRPKAGSAAPVSWVRKRLSDNTVLKHYYFSIEVPKGWSFNAMGFAQPPKATADHSDALVVLTPTEDIQRSSVYLGVRAVYLPYQENLEQKFQRLSQGKNDKSRTLKLVEWHERKWIFSQYQIKGAQGMVMQFWAAYTIQEGREIWATAGAPAAEANHYFPVFLKAMESILVF